MKHHPDIPNFSQCTAANYFEEDYKWLETLYNLGSVFGMYFIPLAFIVFCYAAIVFAISGNFNAQGKLIIGFNGLRNYIIALIKHNS